MRASFLNLATAATLTGTTTFADATWPPANVLDPTRPHVRAYSANLTDQRITLDLGAPTSVDAVALIHANFTSAVIQAAGTDAWGAPAYSQAVTLARSGTGRYHYADRPSTAAKRFWSVSIPAQASTDGATVFKLGGIWIGTFVSPPREILLRPKETKQEARLDTKTDDGRMLDRLLLDEPTWRITAARQAWGLTELAAWRDFDRQWSEAPGQVALVLWRDAIPNECYLMRREDDETWEVGDRLVSEGGLECAEVTLG